MRQFHIMLAMAAQLSVYALALGNSYGSPKASPAEREPMPPVTYILRPVMSSQSRRSVFP